MLKDKIRQLLNLVFAIVQPIVGYIGSQELTGPSIGTISNRYPTYVVPAGYAFTIWSVIFALCLGYGIWQALPAQRENPMLRRVGWYTTSALACTSVWTFIFQRSLFALSVFVMVWLLGSLIAVVVRMYESPTPLSGTERWLVYVNFSIFLGWITVATVANIGQTLTAAQWSGWGLAAETWGVVALLAAGMIAAVVTTALRGNVPYALTVIWALVAVAVNQFSGAIVTHSTSVGAAAIGAILLVGIALIISYTRQATVRRGRFDTPLET